MKRKYFIEFSFEDSLNGVIELTDEEFETVRRVTNPLNWEEPVKDWQSYRCGDFRIVPLEEREKELEIITAIQKCDWDNPTRLCAECPAEDVCFPEEDLGDN